MNEAQNLKCLVLAPDRQSGPKDGKITSARSAHTPTNHYTVWASSLGEARCPDGAVTSS